MSKQKPVAHTGKYCLSDADMLLLEERRKKCLNGESKTYSWEEAKKIITGKSKVAENSKNQ